MKTAETKLSDSSMASKQKVGVSHKFKELENNFILVEAESLSPNDEFMKHKPRTEEERKTKALIMEVINEEIKNFYCSKYDPSFANDEEGIRFVARKKPAVGKSYSWWVEAAKKYWPELNSRLGTRLEYGAFLGVLIKKLIEEGMPTEWAWNAVCNDSEELGHYRNSENAGDDFEKTGSRNICGFCDLANTFKLLSDDDAENKGFYWTAAGECTFSSYFFPIANLDLTTERNSYIDFCVGWIVLSVE